MTQLDLQYSDTNEKHSSSHVTKAPNRKIEILKYTLAISIVDKTVILEKKKHLHKISYLPLHSCIILYVFIDTKCAVLYILLLKAGSH